MKLKIGGWYVTRGKENGLSRVVGPLHATRDPQGTFTGGSTSTWHKSGELTWHESGKLYIDDYEKISTIEFDLVCEIPALPAEPVPPTADDKGWWRVGDKLPAYGLRVLLEWTQNGSPKAIAIGCRERTDKIGDHWALDGAVAQLVGNQVPRWQPLPVMW